MKKFFGNVMFPAAVSAALLMAACGSDDNSSNVEYDGDSSSSVEKESSSSEAPSSSSVASDLPEGVRAATLDDLDKNISLGKMFGTEVFLATGAKQGVFSIWIPDSAWMVVHSEFENGVLEYGAASGSFMGTGVVSSDSLKAFFEKGGRFAFVVKDDTLRYSLNDGDYVVAKKADVRVSDNWLSDGTKLQGQKLSCTSGDTSHTYSFFKGRFLDEMKVGENESWSAGYYDIQRSHLLMLPIFYDKAVLSLTSGQVSSSYNVKMSTGTEYSCEKSSFKFSDVARDEIAGRWTASSNDRDWILSLDASGIDTVETLNGQTREDFKFGIWDVYGDMLFIQNESCMEPSKCAHSVKGTVEGFDPEVGFTYKNDDAGTPAMPETWTVLKFE